MTLLTGGHLTCHPGNIAALVELLVVADRPLPDFVIEELLQPREMRNILGTDPVQNSIKHAIDVAEWCKLVERKEKGVALIGPVKDLKMADLLVELPVLASQGLFDRKWTGKIEVDRAAGGDLALVLSWFLAQNPFTGGLTNDALSVAYFDQVNTKEELVNSTKLGQVRRWARWFGLGRYDVANKKLFVPDPTVAVGRCVANLPKKYYTGTEFINDLSKLCSVLDNGKVRKSLFGSLKTEELPWETDSKKVSPSLNLAMWRLKKGGKIDYGLKADAKQSHRCEMSTIESSTEIFSYVEIQ
jgi:hypothetical protein